MKLKRTNFRWAGVIALVWTLLAPAFLGAVDDPSGPSPRLLVHLLDYLAVDYGGAVKNGKVISLSEYKEQQEFIKTVVDLSKTLPEVKSSPDIQTLVDNLNSLIQSKADPVQVAQAARQTQAKVIERTGLAVAPSEWPNLAAGKKLFENTCFRCHGLRGMGDGPDAHSLTPKPANFQDREKMEKMTAFQIFNTVRLGVPNTPMAAFATYSDQDTWNLAFYVLSLRYTDRPIPTTKADLETVEKQMGLAADQLLPKIATSSDEDLKKGFPGNETEKAEPLAKLRTYSQTGGAQAALDSARLNIQAALDDYLAGHIEIASQKALAAYVEGVEPVEPRLKANDPQFVTNLEQLMGLVRSAINGHKPPDEVKLTVQKALEALAQASALLQQKAPTPWLTFSLAFGILLREGFEALLLIVTLLGIIRASGAQKARRWVHAGWLAAVALGFAAWFLSGWLMNISGLGRELMEGITGVLTVIILLFIGFWLHSRTEITRWKAFIQVQIRSALEEKNLIQLAFISFLAAFREAIETVLFLRAIWLEGGSDTKTALGLGVLTAFAAILVLGWLLLAFSTKVPIKALFNVSSIIMIALALILTGKAIHSFQEVDFIAVTLSPLNLHLDWLGIYPTNQTLLAQLGILALSVFLWVYGKRPSKTPGRK